MADVRAGCPWGRRPLLPLTRVCGPPQLASPRVNKALLPSFVGRQVSLVGKTIAVAGPLLTLLASDGQNVTVHLGGAGSPTT